MADNFIGETFISGFNFRLSDFEELSKKGIKFDTEQSVRFNADEISIENIDLVLSVLPNAQFEIKKESFQFKKEILVKLIEYDKYLKKYGKQITFPVSKDLTNNHSEELWTLDTVINANAKLNDWAEEINSATINGEKLSPFEKFLYAYQIVTKFKYKEEDYGEVTDRSRDVVSVLNSDYIVCVGYANLLSQLCKMIGIKCYTQSVASEGTQVDHANCCVEIEDDKYDIHGIYYSDPCWDSATDKQQPTLQHSLIKFDSISKIFKYKTMATVDGIAQFNERNDSVQKPLSEIKSEVLNYNTEQTQENLKQIKELRKTLNIPQPTNAVEDITVLFSQLSNALGYPFKEFYNIDLKNLFSSNDKYNEEKWSKLLAEYTDDQIIEALKYYEYINIQGRIRYVPKMNGQEPSIYINSNLIKKVRSSSKIQKDKYISALKNIYIAKGLSDEKTDKKANEKWERSIEETSRTQNLDNEETEFIIEASKKSYEDGTTTN